MSDPTSAEDAIHEPPLPRKKPRRIWLYLPFVLIGLLLLGYGGYWTVASQRLAASIEARASDLRDAGYAVELEGRRIQGFPFRMKLSFQEARLASPSGWSVTVPGLTGEAYLHQLGHWVVAAPQGLSFTRPVGGQVAVRGQVLRASLAGMDAVPWRIVVQARDAAFTPGPGARPFSLAGAELIELYLRPAPGDGGEGMALFRLEGGRAHPETALGRIAGVSVATATLDARLTRLDAFRGEDWGRALRAWSRAEGIARSVQGTASAGDVSVRTQDGTLGVGYDGRLVGALPLELRQAEAALTALAEAEAVDPDAAGSAAAVAAARAQGQAATINLVFQAGVVTLGPVMLGPSPQVG